MGIQKTGICPSFVQKENNQYIYHYIYKDHLGNNRLTYADLDGDGEVYSTEILEENNYYPFGLRHKGYNELATENPSGFKYKFGGKELNDELGFEVYDFGARNYDPALGRWMNIDPLAEEMRRFSPYNYAFNNPVFFIDPDGMKPFGFDKSKLDELKPIVDINEMLAYEPEPVGMVLDKGDDWYKDSEGNYIYDSKLTKRNASTRLSENETYIGESRTINVTNSNGKTVGKIYLSKDGSVSSEGGFLSGNESRTSINGLVKVDYNLKGGIKIYGTENNKSFFHGNAKDTFEYYTFKGTAKRIKELDIKIKNISYEITNHHRRVQLNEKQRNFDKWFPSYSEDGRKVGDAGDALNTSRHERDSVNKVRSRQKMLIERNNLKNRTQ